ncbi:hypothetical protein EDC29_11132 [Marichromatium gracile]|uniref:Uncharacterized protein n=1 Tax=Marichromatium gracile TaxID=1048 RepID=A0A4R4A6B4_MARGR|nr:hypothetical protein EDC29_11132 [Marichromatium gracile]
MSKDGFRREGVVPAGFEWARTNLRLRSPLPE